MNLAYHYPIVYWNTACLTINGGADDSLQTNKSTDYGKISVAICNMQRQGIDIGLPDINRVRFDFAPDEENNRIIFALKALNGIGDEVSREIIANQPYASIEDFCERMVETKKVKTTQMIQLIKAGCFTELHSKNRVETMDWFLRKYVFTPCANLTMQQFNRILELNMIPDSLKHCVSMLNLKDYILDDEGLYEIYIDPQKKMVKKGYHDRFYILDSNSQPYFKKYLSESSVVGIKGDFYIVSEKKLTKEIETVVTPLKQWLADPKTLELYNQKLFSQVMNKYAKGSLAKWSMQSLSFYPDDHELDMIDEDAYGIVNFFELPEEPETYETYTRYVKGIAKQVPKFKIVRIAGTVLDSDNIRHTASILTRYGVVDIKFNKGQFAFYDKRISARLDPNSDKKTVLEDGWLKRGTLVTCQGYRRGDRFNALVYNDTIYSHTLNLIKEIKEDGTMILCSERAKISDDQSIDD